MDKDPRVSDLPPPGEIRSVNGYQYWYGGGRLTLSDREHIIHQTSILLRNFPADTSVEELLKIVQEKFERTVRQKMPTEG